MISSSYVSNFGQRARLKTHPSGHDILDVSDLYRRAPLQNEYVRAIIQKTEYAIVAMQMEQQAALYGKLRYIQAASTFAAFGAMLRERGG